MTDSLHPTPHMNMNSKVKYSTTGSIQWSCLSCLTTPHFAHHNLTIPCPTLHCTSTHHCQLQHSNNMQQPFLSCLTTNTSYQRTGLKLTQNSREHLKFERHLRWCEWNAIKNTFQQQPSYRLLFGPKRLFQEWKRLRVNRRDRRQEATHHWDSVTTVQTGFGDRDFQ